MKTQKYEITGTCALMMHNQQLANPINEYAKAIKAIVRKPAKQKTDKDHEDVARQEFEGGMYFDKELGPYIPGENVEACLRDAARMSRKGEEVRRSISVLENKIPLQYKGPRDVAKMWSAGFKDTRPVSGQGKKGTKTMRTRPIFNEWSITFTVVFEEDRVSEEDITTFVEMAGKYVGICDNRPRYGKFSGKTVG